MRLLFALTIFAGSGLLFVVQPLVAKMVLPLFGGAPGVWITAMLFFQASLLLGYVYAHMLARRVPFLWQGVVHGALMLVALLFLPVAIPDGYSPPAVRYPNLALLWLLVMIIGVPFVVLSANAPLLQSWFSRTYDPLSKDPYFLYVASNFGSLVALLSYPFLLEPTFQVQAQAQGWAVGFGAVLILLAGCGAYALRMRSWEDNPSFKDSLLFSSLSWRLRLLWLLCAFVPSSFLLGVTHYLTSNVTPVPLLWVIPLCLYLMTFMVAFSRKQVLTSSHAGRMLLVLAGPFAVSLALESSDPAVPLAIFHLVVFVIVALVGHLRLAETRPDPAHLTEYYLWIALGGVLGGVFNGLLAPVLFRGLVEYPLALILGCAIVPLRESGWRRVSTWAYPFFLGLLTAVLHYLAYQVGMRPGWGLTGLTLGIPVLLAFLGSSHSLRFALSLGAILLVSGFMSSSPGGRVLLTERSFFGIHRIVERENGHYRAMIHGVILHGLQSIDPTRRTVPLAYYYPTSPLGKALGVMNQISIPYKVGIVGLGTGACSAYGRKGDEYVFFEIDPVVLELARDSGHFTYLSDSKAKVRYVLGDARLTLANEPDFSYDVLILDAFSSDSIPAHLLTLEAMQIYMRKLKKDGILLFHISNKYLDLRYVVVNTASVYDLACYFFDDTSLEDREKALGKLPSKWILIGRKESAHIARIVRDPAWTLLKPIFTRGIWTDNFYDIVGVFRWSGD